MTKNNKGFVVTEVLILSTVIIGVLIFMYSQFKNINRGYQYSFKYDTPEGMYLANNIVNYINEGNYDKLVELLNNTQEGYIDITECNIDNSNLISYCEALFQKSEIEKIIFTEENLEKIKQNMNNFDNDLKNYINQIKTTNEKNDYRIIIKYIDGTFASMRFNKGNSYVEEGLIAHLDGINNTGNGHSTETQIWKDLSNHGNDATLYNNPIWSNNSLTFDGLTNYGKLENTAGMTYENGVTLETRVKVISFVGKNGSGSIEFLGNWQDAGGGLYYDTNYFRGNLYLNSAWRGAINNSQSDLETYYTVTNTYDNSVVKFYINGSLVATREDIGNAIIKSSPAPFAIGGNPNATGMDNYANVEFQNVLIYDRALTENEVMRNYQADMAKY